MLTPYFKAAVSTIFAQIFPAKFMSFDSCAFGLTPFVQKSLAEPNQPPPSV
jgi:hypothetical protein